MKAAARDSAKSKTKLIVASFILSVVVLGIVVLRSFRPFPAGEWRPDLIGYRIREIPLANAGGDSVPIVHPSLILFFRTACEPCKHAAAALARFAGEPAGVGVPILAITADHITSSPTIENQTERDVIVMQLESGVPQLAFVTQVPMFVRTDSLGDVALAFVGVPSRAVLDKMR